MEPSACSGSYLIHYPVPMYLVPDICIYFLNICWWKWGDLLGFHWRRWTLQITYLTDFTKSKPDSKHILKWISYTHSLYYWFTWDIFIYIRQCRNSSFSVLHCLLHISTPLSATSYNKEFSNINILHLANEQCKNDLILL